MTDRGRRGPGAATKVEAEPRPDGKPDKAPPKAKRSFNEAAHKLGYWPVRPAPRTNDNAPSEALRAATDDDRDVVAHAGKAVLALGALGIVYGDIGTSPLYTEQFIFTVHANAAHPDVAGVYGIA